MLIFQVEEYKRIGDFLQFLYSPGEYHSCLQKLNLMTDFFETFIQYPLQKWVNRISHIDRENIDMIEMNCLKNTT